VRARIWNEAYQRQCRHAHCHSDGNSYGHANSNTEANPDTKNWTESKTAPHPGVHE
jgi:hypothetical protein